MPSLPPGQAPRADFPRFGLTPYATRRPSRPNDPSLAISVGSVTPTLLSDALKGLPRTTLVADFHCVTTWTHCGLTWGGVRFADFFQERVLPLVQNQRDCAGVVLRAQDGYHTTMVLEDLLAADVLLADELNGQPLTIEHGAPLRLIAPQHYGYKNLKHLQALEFHPEMPVIKRGLRSLLDHPRARVALEERGRWAPGWLLRHVYRPFIARTVEQFRIGER